MMDLTTNQELGKTLVPYQWQKPLTLSERKDKIIANRRAKIEADNKKQKKKPISCLSLLGLK